MCIFILSFFFFCFILDTHHWTPVKVNGIVPPARSASSLVAVGTKLYLFGGLSHLSGWFDDLFVFDTGDFLLVVGIDLK